MTPNRRAKIIGYWQIVDEFGSTIEDAHSYKEAVEIKKRYETNGN